jgi:4'-phosphopantetheinyl transferase
MCRQGIEGTSQASPRGADLYQGLDTSEGKFFPSHGGIEVIAHSLAADSDSIRESAQCLSDDERHRADRFVFARDRRRFIAARARLRQILGAKMAISPNKVEFTYNARGKPALAHKLWDMDLRFNLSHSEDVAVYVFAVGRDVGIDVEAVRALPDADDVASRFFSARENAAYSALDQRDKPQGFFNCWTRKEAFIKALGEGLHHPLDRFDVSLAPDARAEILRVDDVDGSDCGWSLDSFTPLPGFVGAVVTEQFK